MKLLDKSTSKFQLTFPAAVYRIQSTRVRNSLDLAQLLLVCNDVAVFLEDNRRYCPEVIGFLLNTLMLANAPPITGSTNTTLLSTFSTTDHFLYFNERVRSWELVQCQCNFKLALSFRANLRAWLHCQSSPSNRRITLI